MSGLLAGEAQTLIGTWKAQISLGLKRLPTQDLRRASASSSVKGAMKNQFLGFGESDEWGCDPQVMGIAALQLESRIWSHRPGFKPRFTFLLALVSQSDGDSMTGQTLGEQGHSVNKGH